MASPIVALHVFATLLCGIGSANVVTFDSHLLGNIDHDHPDLDLLLVVSEGKSLRKSALDEALRALDGGHAHLQRTRGLKIAQCMDCKDFANLMARYHLNPADLPMVFLYPQATEETRRGKFGMHLKDVDQPLDALTSFINAFDADELTSWVRSEKEPTAQHQGLVRVVVGSTFEREVIDAEKHVLLLIHGDHDVAAAKVETMLEQLSKELVVKTRPSSDDTDDENVGFKVARFNSDANDFPPSVNMPAHDAGLAIYLFRDDDKGDPDLFPQEEEPSSETILSWMNEMLPQQNYGLDVFFSQIAKTLQGAKEHEPPHIHEI